MPTRCRNAWAWQIWRSSRRKAVGFDDPVDVFLPDPPLFPEMIVLADLAIAEIHEQYPFPGFGHPLDAL